MREFDFVIDQTALVAAQNSSIGANFAECEAALLELMTPYAKMVVSESNLPQAKADRARIRRVASSIDEARKEVKRRYMAPYTRFEEQAKKLVAICNEADANIAAQVNAFDDKRREDKMESLRGFFAANVRDMGDYISFEQIADKRWGNVTYSEEQAHSDILREISTCIAAVGAIKALKSPLETALLDTYRETRDLPLCIRKHELWQRQEQFRREREEAASKAADEVLRQESPAPEAQTYEDAAEEEETHVLDFRVHVTLAQMEALRRFLRENGIVYTPVPKE